MASLPPQPPQQQPQAMPTNMPGGMQPQPTPDPNAFINSPHIPSPTDSPAVGPTNGDPQEQQLRGFLESVNIAEDLDEDLLQEIGADAKRGFEDDLESRADWEADASEWTKLAGQIREEKNFPWRHASNVKYPLLSTAAMQFNARAYPSLLPSTGDIVMGQVIGKDPDGSKLEKANRIGKYMSYQILYEMDGWEEEMDKMLMTLPIIGTMFKKTYWDSITKKNKSCLIGPKSLVVNYWATSLEDSERVSEIILMSPRKLKEKQKAKVYLDIDLGQMTAPILDTHSLVRDSIGQSGTDKTTPYELIEQHTYLDLNDDGIAEPYIITFDRASSKVLRISARFDEKSFITGDDGKIVSITPIQYYTKFGFVPNPDGSFYDIGFGALLGPINEAVNTLNNQLIDAGTLSNLQSGWIGKGLRLKAGEQPFQPGEWKAVNATGDDLKKQIVPLPTKEPSMVLFQLMGSLITSGKELASVAEIFVGKMPGQNTPATTTMATIDQGMKVFTAVYKRIYRSLDSELRKLFRLNNVYLDLNTYSKVLDTQVQPTDFDGTGFDIMPAADPTASSGQEKMGKAEALLQLLPIGVLDPVKVVQRILDAQEQPNWQDLISPSAGQPKPDPKAQELQLKTQADQAAGQQQMQIAAQKAALDNQSKQTQMQMKAQEHAVNVQANQQLTATKIAGQQAMDKARVYGELAKGQAKAESIKTIARSQPSPAKKKT